MKRAKATGKDSKPQQQAASEAASQNAQAAPAGSGEESATNSAAEADEASGHQAQSPGGLPADPAEPGSDPAGSVAGASETKAAEEIDAAAQASQAAVKIEADKAAALAKTKVDANAVREFEVKRPLLHDGEELPPGSQVSLTRKQFLVLKAATVVDGEWPEDQEA